MVLQSSVSMSVGHCVFEVVPEHSSVQGAAQTSVSMSVGHCFLKW